MTKAELVSRLTQLHPHLSRREVRFVIETFFKGVAAAMSRGDRSSYEVSVRFGRNLVVPVTVATHAPAFASACPISIYPPSSRANSWAKGSGQRSKVAPRWLPG
jgi:hypothetical protein